MERPAALIHQHESSARRSARQRRRSVGHISLALAETPRGNRGHPAFPGLLVASHSASLPDGCPTRGVFGSHTTWHGDPRVTMRGLSRYRGLLVVVIVIVIGCHGGPKQWTRGRRRGSRRLTFQDALGARAGSQVFTLLLVVLRGTPSSEVRTDHVSVPR